MSLAAKTIHAILLTVKCRWNATFAGRAPLRQLAVESKDLVRLHSIAMRPWAIGAVPGLQRRRSGAATRRVKAASLLTLHPNATLVLEKFGRRCSSVAIGRGRPRWLVVRCQWRNRLPATKVCPIGMPAGHPRRNLGAAPMSRSAARATSTLGPVRVRSNTWSSLTTSFTAVLGARPVAQRVAAAGILPVVAAGRPAVDMWLFTTIMKSMR
mmetsp:Transcript_88361/g.108177  ORF Transcript_88361/g.108177 Transcript_88361/m.108177 type:complete len:211 (-) Transcript_88361:114-746(-)